MYFRQLKYPDNLVMAGLNMPNVPSVYDSDEILAEALQQANQDALNILYDRYSSAILGVLQKITGDNDMAEEAMQVCFINIWQNKSLYNSSKERLFTWMFKIAKEAANAAMQEKTDKKNQGNTLYVSGANQGNGKVNNIASITEMIIFGNITQEEAAGKMGVSIAELRQMVRKEINKLRGI